MLARKDFVYKIQATVGKLVKDLEIIIEKAPNSLLWFKDPDTSNEIYIAGVESRNGITVLTTDCCDDTFTVTDLHKKLCSQDTSAEVLVEHNGFYMLELVDEEAGVFFKYDEECDYNDICLSGNDIRLYKSCDLLSASKRDIPQECLDWKVMCRFPDGCRGYVHFVDFAYSDDVRYLAVYDNEGLTVAELIDSLEDDECGVIAYYRDGVGEPYYITIKEHKPGTIFYDYSEGIICFDLGSYLDEFDFCGYEYDEED